MTRTVINSSARGEVVVSQPDGYLSRLVKYIPSEVIALYLTLDPLMRSDKEFDPKIYWIVFALGVIITPLYLWAIQK